MWERQEVRVRSPGREDPLEKEAAAHSSILAWRIPQTEEPGGLQSLGSQRVGHSSAHTRTRAHVHAGVCLQLLSKEQTQLPV